MATLKHKNDIDHRLQAAFEAWVSLPNVEVWDFVEQLDFIEEWPLEESRLDSLRHDYETGRMSAEQSSRYEELLSVVDSNREIIERLRAT